MAMVKHFEAPGSAEWHARRARCFNAGDASAVLGCHPSGKTRTQLLQELHTGVEQEFSDYVQQRVIDPGHRVEARWRPIAEEIVGEDLAVIAGSLDVGLSRPLGASLDGITFMEDLLGECKSANEALRGALPHEGRDSHQRNDARQLPKGYRVQLEQQQLVTGASRTLFSACRFNDDGSVDEERHCWYSSDPALRAEILAGWRQFDADLAAYVPPSPAAVERVAAEPVEALPAVFVKVEGSIVIRENFDVFEQAMRDFLEHRLIRQPKSDQDFADLDQQIKAMKGAEAALEAAEAGWIAQIEPVSVAKRRKDMLRGLVRENRLLAEKLLASEKERRRGEIVAGGVKALADHIAALNERLGRPYMPAIPADFGGCIRGLKSLASMEDKVATELARAKAAASEAAMRIQLNLATLRELASEHKTLFPDAATLVLKAPEDCRAAVTARIAEHRAAEEKRAAELAERERARIRAEEEARAREQARREQEAAEAERRRQEQVALEQRQREEAAARAEQERQAAAAESARQAAAAPAPTQPAAPAPIAQPAPVSQAAAASPQVVPMPTRAPAAQPKAPASVSMTALNEALGINVTSSLLDKVGFPASVVPGKAGKFYSPDDLGPIARAVARYLVGRAEFFEQREAA